MRAAESVWKPSPRTLRQFAGLWFLVGGAVAYRHGSETGIDLWTLLLLGVAAGVGLPGLLWPRSVRLLYLACVLATFPVGWCVFHVLVALIYYGLFTPLGLLFRLRGRDPLSLRARPGVETYWRPWEGSVDVRDYFRQY
jgi:hypothetical protein